MVETMPSTPTSFHIDPWIFTRKGIAKTLSLQPTITDNMQAAHGKLKSIFDEVSANLLVPSK